MSEVVATRLTLRQLRGYLAGIIAGIVVMLAALVLVARATDDARDAARDVHAEIARSEAERCRVTMLSRQGSLEKDIRVWTRFGREVGAPQERIDEFIDGIREDYDDLPVPADCR